MQWPCANRCARWYQVSHMQHSWQSLFIGSTLLFSWGFRTSTASTSPTMTEPWGWWTRLQRVSCWSLRILFLHMGRAMSTVLCSSDPQHCSVADPANCWPLSLHIFRPATSSTGRTTFLTKLSCILPLLMGELYSTLLRGIWETTSAGDRQTVSDNYIQHLWMHLP